jgi:YVTN family beta-propeller protein
MANQQRLLRDVFAAYRGEEIDTQGDSFFVAFRSAADAVSAAVAVQRALAAHEWPDGAQVRVRVGIHTGEAAAAGERYVGFSVHRASRIGGAAHGGQVLLSSATRELVEDDLPDGVSLRDLGLHRLKDIDRPERIGQVAADGLQFEFPALRNAAPVKTPRLLQRRSLLVATLAGVVAAAVAIPLFALGGSSGGPIALASVDANNVGVLDANGGRISGQTPVTGTPSSVAAGDGAIWVTADDGTVSRLNPGTSSLVQTIPVGVAPSGVAVTRGFVWVANSSDGTVTRIDVQTNRPGPPIGVGNGPSEIAVGDGSVWVANTLDGTVSRIDAGSGKVVKTYSAGRYANGVAFGAGSLWVADESSNSVVRIDPRRGSIIARMTVGSGPTRLAFGAGSLWVANSLGTTVSQIDSQTDQEAAAIRVGGGPSGIAVDSGGVWVSVEFGEKVVRIDPKTDRVVETIAIGNHPEGIAIERGKVFVAARSSGRRHRGGTLTVLNGRFPDASVEGGSPAAFILAGGLNNSLVAFKRVGGVEGLQLVPDLATSLPDPTDGGRTYTFQLRRGIRYSNGKPLRPSDVRPSIERAFKLAPPGSLTAGPVVGNAACRSKPKTCDLARGIFADDTANTVSFHLTAPDPYFLYNLNFGILPASTPDKVVDVRSLPVTGPYVVASYRPGHEAILVRNPRFHMWSQAAQPDGFADRIVEKLAVPRAKAVHMVERGSADLTTPDQFKGQVAARYPGQLHTGLGLQTIWLFLNTRVAPFNDVRVRRAVNYAIDRKLWLGLLDVNAHPTCQVLPPAFPGYRSYCPYTVAPGSGTWIGPDLARAQQLVAASHTEGMPITVWWATPLARAYAPHVVTLLKRLGYRAKLKSLPTTAKYFSAIGDSRNRAQIGLAGWFADYPAASDFINFNFSCRSFRPANPDLNNNSSEFCDPTIDTQIKRALALDRSDPGAANLLWRRIDHLIVDQAPVVPLVNPSWALLVSKRVGNFQVSTATIPIPLLEQIWVR